MLLIQKVKDAVNLYRTAPGREENVTAIGAKL